MAPETEAESDNKNESVNKVIDAATRDSDADFDYVNVSASITVYVPQNIEELDDDLLDDKEYDEKRVKKEVAERKAGRAMSEEYGVDDHALRSETTTERVDENSLSPAIDGPAEKWRVAFVIQE